MAKNIFYMVSILVLIAIAGFLLLRGEVVKTADVDGVAIQGNIQKVTLGIKNYNYYPNTVRVKAGQPVSISLDASVSGCLRDFTIRDLGIREYLKTPKDTLDFTPTKKGTFRFACSMGMGTGTLIVE